MRVLALLALAAMTACDGGNATAGAALPPGPTVLSVEMSSYRFQHDQQAMAGRVVVNARNVDDLAHQIVLVRVPDDLEGTLAEQLRSETRRPAQTLQQLSVEPGRRRAFALDLAPGRYGFVCFVTDDDGVTHARKGMASDLFVRAR